MKKKYFCILFLSLFFIFAFHTDNCLSQWVQMSNGLNPSAGPSCFLTVGSNIYIGTSDVVIQPAGVYVSTNNGELWSHNSMPYLTITSLAVNENRIFAGILSNGIRYTDNFGLNWNLTSLNSQTAGSIRINGNKMFAISGSTAYISTNNGVNWTSSGLTYNPLSTIELSGENIYAGGDVSTITSDNGGMWLSTNSGGSWSRILYNQSVLRIAINGNYVFAGTRSHGIYLTTDNGSSWSQIAFDNNMITSLTIKDNIIFAGVNNNNGIYISTNNGLSWIQKNEGFGPGAPPQIGQFYFKDNYAFVTTNASVWRRNYSEILGIARVSSDIPASFSLSQNYPNPFNPVTNIRYTLAKNCFVKLVVFDVLGNEIESLVNQKQNAGTFEVTFNASQYPSGTYYYRLTVGDFTETRKMVLIK